jgi:hypothetical protein
MAMARSGWALWSMMGALLLTIAGCGTDYKVAPVSGRIILDNQPLVGASVSFAPMDGDKKNNLGSGSYAKTDSEGRYTLKLIENDKPGAAVGRHRVSISLANQSDPNSEGTIVTDRVPERYRGSESELTFEVKPGGSEEADFRLYTDTGS